MAINPIREGFHTVTPYLVVHGATGLLEFLKRAFEAEEKLRVPRLDGTLLHADVRIGDSMIEMADASGGQQPTTSAIHLYVRDADATYQRALAAGATSMLAPMNTEFGDRLAIATDHWGNRWYISTHLPAAASGGYIQEGLRTVTPFVHPKAADAFIEFLTLAFGAEEKQVVRPSPDGPIVHAKVCIGDSIIEISEARDGWAPMRTTLHLYVSDADSVYKQALAAGAASVREPRDEPFGDRLAAVEDPFGNYWYIATHLREMDL